MEDLREEPTRRLDERPMLDAWLDYHRATLLVKCEGLTPEQLRARSVPPSTLSLLGLVRHMAEVERNWFRRVMAGEDAPPRFYDPETNPDGDFDDVDAADVEENFAYFASECAAARAISASITSLDAVGQHRGGPTSMRWVLVHMIEEYARHNGHADLLREAIDGTTGE
ncbi:MAG: DinB family protein [Acidimicrobiia bacterium]